MLFFLFLKPCRVPSDTPDTAGREKDLKTRWSNGLDREERVGEKRGFKKSGLVRGWRGER